MIFQLLIGIVIAAAIFASLLWSIYRGTTTVGMTRSVALLLSFDTVLAMGAISFNSPNLGSFFGGCLVTLGVISIWLDQGWSRLLPLVQVIFGIVLILGLPFVGS